MKHLLLSALLLAGLAGCGRGSSELTRPYARQPVHIYANNHSRLDTLVNLALLVDDSLVLAQPLPYNESSSEDSIKIVWLCEGAHHVKVDCGRYTRDTTLVIKQSMSLVISMMYDALPADESQSGLGVIPIIRQDNSR